MSPGSSQPPPANPFAFNPPGPDHDKIHENRLRRAAQRQGMVLRKSPRRDPRSLGYGTFMLQDARTAAVVHAGPEGHFGLTIEEVERLLTG